MRVLVRLNSIFPSLRQGMLDFGSKHFCQVGNEYHFIGVFIPKVGNTIHFRPKKMSEPSVNQFEKLMESYKKLHENMAINLLQFLVKELQAKNKDEKKLFCVHENRTTPNISVTAKDVMEIVRRHQGINSPDYSIVELSDRLLDIPILGELEASFSHAIKGQPYMCEGCGKLGEN